MSWGKKTKKQEEKEKKAITIKNLVKHIKSNLTSKKKIAYTRVESYIKYAVSF